MLLMWQSEAIHEGIDLTNTGSFSSQAALAFLLFFLLSLPARLVFDFTYVSGRGSPRRSFTTNIHRCMTHARHTQARVQRAEPDLRTAACNSVSGCLAHGADGACSSLGCIPQPHPILSYPIYS